MKSLACVLVCAACGADDGAAFPVEPTTSGSAVASGSSGAAGGGGGTDGTTTLLRGRACVLDDIFSTACANAGAGGLTVTLGDRTTTTSDNGSFTISGGVGIGQSFLISGADVVTTSQALTPSLRIPVLRQAAFDRILAENGIATSPGTGSIFATVVRGGVPVQGVTVQSTPSPAFGPFYDGTQPPPWTLNATGARGIVFLPGVPATGPADLSFRSGTGGEAIVGGVQVIDGGITMVETILP